LFRTVPIKEDGILVSMALFTNMPVNEAINILVDKVFGNDSFKPTYDFELGKEKNQVARLLEIASTNQVFQFNGQLYEQIDEVAMGSPLSPLKLLASCVILKKSLLLMV